MALSERQVLDLLADYGREYDLTRGELRRIVAEVWREVGGPGDGNVDAWLQLILPIVQGAQQATVSLVSGFLDVLSSGFGITATPAVSTALLLGPRLRGGTPQADVYTRPIIEVRRRLAEGASLARARQMATERAVVTAETDTILAHRAGAQEAMIQLRLTHYRRVPTGQSCDLCKLASTQRYRTDQLMPIHPRCDCRVLPAFGTDDPGRIVNRPLYRELKQRGVVDAITRQRQLPKAETALQNARDRVVEYDAEIAAEDDPARRRRLEQRQANWRDTVAERERRVDVLRGERGLPAVRQHGELGPVLTDAGQTFTGPGDLGL